MLAALHHDTAQNQTAAQWKSVSDFQRAEDTRGQRCRSGPFTTRGLTAELAARGIKTDRRAVWVFVRAEGLSFKKSVLLAEQNRPDIARKRRRWKAYQQHIEPHRLVFIDETWVKTNMAPLRGWGPRGQRLAALFLMATGRHSPSLRPYVSIALMHLGSLMDPSTANSSPSTWRRSSLRRSSKAMS